MIKYEEHTIKFFDFEVFPEWWCCTIGTYPGTDKYKNISEDELKNTFITIDSRDIDARRKLLDIFEEPLTVFMGYNIKYYDLMILNAINNGFTARQLRILSDCIINPELTRNGSLEHLRIGKMVRSRYRGCIYQDLFDDNAGSLKEKENCFGLDIRESLVPFDKTNLTDAEIEEVIHYCKHDVYCTMYFYAQVLEPFVLAKLNVGQVFNIPIEKAYTSTNAQLSALVLGARKMSFPDAERLDIIIPPGLEQYIKYNVSQDIIDFLTKGILYFDDEGKIKSNKLVKDLYNNEFVLSNGGIHSVINDDKFRNRKDDLIYVTAKSNDEYAIYDIDFGSFYPAMMIYWGTLSRAVISPAKFQNIYEERLSIKAKKDSLTHFEEMTQRAYKLILNTTYGASGNKFLNLYDPYMTTKTCRLGQLLILTMANQLVSNIKELQILQSNTDGIYVYMKRSSLSIVKQICDNFTKITNILVEVDEIDEMLQKDVNNYAIKKKGKLHTKGGWFVVDTQQPGHNRIRPLQAYISRIAFIDWYFNNLNFADMCKIITSNKSMKMFAIGCTKGPGFQYVIQEYNDGRKAEKLFKQNRVIASTDTSLGEIFKCGMFRGKERKNKMPSIPNHCQVYNENINIMVEPPEDLISAIKWWADNYELDVRWYIQQTADMIEPAKFIHLTPSGLILEDRKLK